MTTRRHIRVLRALAVVLQGLGIFLAIGSMYLLALPAPVLAIVLGVSFALAVLTLLPALRHMKFVVACWFGGIAIVLALEGLRDLVVVSSTLPGYAGLSWTAVVAAISLAAGAIGAFAVGREP